MTVINECHSVYTLGAGVNIWKPSEFVIVAVIYGFAIFRFSSK